MTTFKHFTILAVLLLAAIGCYLLGFKSGVWGFLIVGGVFELSFWIGLFKSFEKQANVDTPHAS